MSQTNLNLGEEYQCLILTQEAQELLSHPILQKDIWHIVDDLKLKMPAHIKAQTIRFTAFALPWLKLLAKLYVLKLANPGESALRLRQDVYNLKSFSDFLFREYINSHNQINDQVFEAFDYWLRSRKLKENTIIAYYETLASFFDVCRVEKWVNVNTYWFKGRRNRSAAQIDEIDYLPEEIWNQLDQNLHYLPEPLQRMVLVIKTMGVRVGELLNMPLDCLRKRGEQWRLRFTTEKYNIEDELPIIPELVVIIKEQQEYIRQHFGENYDNLFCANKKGGNGGNRFVKKDSDELEFQPCSSIMGSRAFNQWLNRLAKKCDIRSKEGELWHFKSHQFRKTIGTVLTNAGVRDLIIQKYLRHRSPDMQRYYKHLLKQVLGDEIEELMRENKYVDVTGKVVAFHKPKNPVTELLRRKMYQITTQYGECYRPVLQAPCQTINACWRCKHWLTSTNDLPYLREDMNRVNEEIKIAQQMGMIRQQQGLEHDRNNLEKYIKGLEQIDG